MHRQTRLTSYYHHYIMIEGYPSVKRFHMFRDPIRTAPLVSDIGDIDLRLKINRADSALFLESNLRLPHLRIS
jgi:hypothetical protein